MRANNDTLKNHARLERRVSRKCIYFPFGTRAACVLAEYLRSAPHSLLRAGPRIAPQVIYHRSAPGRYYLTRPRP
eukprot:359790-Pleurochrysis_carterae.AAC.5